MAAEYGPRTEERIAEFASIRKKRTPILVKMVDVGGGWVEPDEASEPDLMEWPALMIRLRGAFGVGTRADIMAYLMGSANTHATVEEMSHYLLYSKASIREALEGMRRGGGLDRSDTQPAYYSVLRGPWVDVLGMRPELAFRRWNWPDWMRLK